MKLIRHLVDKSSALFIDLDCEATMSAYHFMPGHEVEAVLSVIGFVSDQLLKYSTETIR